MDSNHRMSESKSDALNQLGEQGTINIVVKTYDRITPDGLHFHLCLYEGVCCVMVTDIYDQELTIRYFTNVNKALRFINNL